MQTVCLGVFRAFRLFPHCITGRAEEFVILLNNLAAAKTHNYNATFVTQFENNQETAKTL